MTTPTLFSVNELTEKQIETFKNQYCIDSSMHTEEYAYNGVPYVDFKIVTLREVAPELQDKMTNIPATATLKEIQSLAKAIVAEAVKAGASHFFCTGEPTLTMWANLYASKYVERLESNRLFNLLDEVEWEEYCREMEDAMTCIQSTTEGKRWREIF